MTTQTQQEHAMTFEELASLDKKLATTNFPSEQEAGGLDIAAKLQKVCSIYKTVKPVLGIISSIPFIPSNVKNAVKTFQSVLDTVCV